MVQLDGAELSAQHQGRLRAADRGVDDMLAQGEAVLGALRGQGDTLKAARRKVSHAPHTSAGRRLKCDFVLVDVLTHAYVTCAA